MTLPDTSYLVALLSPRDALHERAYARIRVAPGPRLVTEYVLWETVNQLRSPLFRGRVLALANEVRVGAAFDFVSAEPLLRREPG